jgi:hypothetical protein
MRRYFTRIVALALVLFCSHSASLQAQSADGNAMRFSGALGLNTKYNSNLELSDTGGAERKDAFIGEPTADLRLAKSWGPDWWLDLSFAGQANLHTEHTEENWYFNRGHLSLGRVFGENSANLSSEVRYFTEPQDDRYDFVRHTGLLSYKRVFSPLWQARLGYQNITTQYPQSPSLDYFVNGAFVEVRTTWSFNLSTYYSYDLQSYEGTADPQENNPNPAPEDGLRHTLRLGFDWLAPPRHVLNGTYTFQNDQSEDEGLEIGEFEGHEESQDNEAEFGLTKHKATLLYSFRLNRRTTISAYEEWIYKNFDPDDKLVPPKPGRTDILFLSAVHAKYKWTDAWRLKFRYLFRMNNSSASGEDYTDHIIFIGPEYSF